MSLKVMCAGCSAEERERAESDVRRALGPRAEGDETWIVSVVNVARRLSVTLDGPGIRALTCTAAPGQLADAIRDALQARMGAARPNTDPTATLPPVAPPTAMPVRPAAPAAQPTAAAARPAAATPKAPAAVPRPAAPAAKPAPSFSKPPVAAPKPAPPAAKPAASAPPRPAPVAPTPSAGSRAADSHACAKCGLRFTVICESVPGEERRMAPVACPHCWHLNHVPVPQGAADDHDYRAEKA
jgi:hypothetical protein